MPSVAFQAERAKAIRRLITSLRLAAAGEPVLASRVGFCARDLHGADRLEAEALINQWCLGWGRDDAPVIFMGTEEAYSVDPAEDLAQWNCANALIWASGGNNDLLDALDSRTHNPMFGCPPSSEPEWSSRRREFHIYNTDYIRAQLPHWDQELGRCKRAGRHTWKVIADVLEGPGAWHQLLAPYTGGLGDLCYQVEVSAFPARLSVDGRQQTPERLAFLRLLVARLRSTARVLVFHGRPGWPEWGGRDQIAAAFLGLEPQDMSWVREQYGERERQPQAIWYAEEGGKRVILTRALNGNVRGDLLRRLHQLVGLKERYP